MLRESKIVDGQQVHCNCQKQLGLGQYFELQVRISPPIAAILRQYMVLASQLFAAGHLSGRRIAVPLLRGTLRCVYTHVTLGDCLALLPCHPAQFGTRSAHPPSRRCRVAQRRQYCPFVQTCERGEKAQRRGNANALSALYPSGKSSSVRSPHIKNAGGSVHMPGTPTDARNKTFRCGWCGVFRGE